MGAVFVATCIASAIGCFVMGFVGNYPIALAPGMGLNAYFTFAVVKGMGVDWRVALGAVFISGIIFILFSFFKVREMLVNALPMGLKMSIAAGIGLFLATITPAPLSAINAKKRPIPAAIDIFKPIGRALTSISRTLKKLNRIKMMPEMKTAPKATRQSTPMPLTTAKVK